ncbi:MAG: hypothetical protein ACK56I_04480, partial [bacterium]
MVTGPVWDRSGVIVRCVGGELLRATPATSEGFAVFEASCDCASREGLCICGPTACLLGVCGFHANDGHDGELVRWHG